MFLAFSKSGNINKNTSRIGFPLSNKDRIYSQDFPQINMIARGNYFNHFINIIIDMDNKTQTEKIFKEGNIPEIIIDYTKNPDGEMVINLNFNETLSKIRKLKEKKINPYSNNIMILYIDSVSRNNALRQLTLIGILVRILFF